MATDVIAPGGADEGNERPRPPEPTRSVGGGFFHVYKSGQGYWTRMGTAAGAALIGLLTAEFIYSELPPRIDYLQQHHNVALMIAVGFLLVYGLVVWYFVNKPTAADFLIATDLEMKKVNWTSRQELIGSTKVVIVFMFLIAGILFVTDILFGYFFFYCRVLEHRPF